MADQTLRFTLDLSDIETADDGNTTYYGGSYLFNGEERRGRGNDRSDSYIDDIVEAIATAVQANWPDALDDEAYDAIKNGFDGVENEMGGVGTIVVTVGPDGTLLVTNE